MGSVIRMFRDSLTNLIPRMGTDRDKAAHTFYGTPLLLYQRSSVAYRDAWLPRKILDIPALDSCRNWRNWHSTTIRSRSSKPKRSGSTSR